MKVIVVLNVDPDELLDLHSSTNIESAVEAELGWVQESGMYVSEVIAPDEISPNDTDLGKMIRSKMEN